MTALVRSLSFVLTTVVFGLVYPVVITGFAQVAFKTRRTAA